MAFSDGTAQAIQMFPTGSLDGHEAIDLLKASADLIPVDESTGYAEMGSYYDDYYKAGGGWVIPPVTSNFDHSKAFNLLNAANRFAGATGWYSLNQSPGDLIPSNGIRCMNAGYWSFNDAGAFGPGPYADLALNISFRFINGNSFFGAPNNGNPDIGAVIYMTKDGGATFHRLVETPAAAFADITRFSANIGKKGTLVLNDAEFTLSHNVGSISYTTPKSFGVGIGSVNQFGLQSVGGAGTRWTNGTAADIGYGAGITDPLASVTLTPGQVGIAIAMFYEGEALNGVGNNAHVTGSLDGSDPNVNDCGIEITSLAFGGTYNVDYGQVMMGT